MPPALNQLLNHLPRWLGAARTPVQRTRLALTAGIVLAAGGLGWALAAAVAVWIELSLGTEPGPAPAPVRPAASVQRVQPQSAFDAILTTNVFHARRSGSTAAGPVRLTLTGTFHIGDTAFALVIGPDGRTEDVYKTGECVPRVEPVHGPPCPSGQGRLVQVGHDRITVDFGGQRSIITMEIPAGNAPQSPAAPAAAAAATPGSNAPFGQTRIGNTIEVHVPAVEVEKTFENFSEIVRQALIVPFAKDGATVGFQIQRIQPGSVFQRIGLQNQDVIRGVNGQPITTADQALRLFTLFRNERQVLLDVDRGQESLKLSYLIE